ncbi:MAG: GNAT family N-acetyltransferase [Deltaproteobacteria bacterium]|nr:MAG: GNAT family N-acetyltransferase [Deltaproteobacteria bacterium]
MSMSKLVFSPFDCSRDGEVRRLFQEYPHKDFQLKSMKVSKEDMADYLETTLQSAGTQSICLRANGKLVGLIALKSLPWMSEHFGLKMCAVPHLLAGFEGPLVRARLLRYVIEELQEVDFLDCRIAADDVYAAQALEAAGFRYVGTEAFLGQELRRDEPVDPPAGIEIAECSRAGRKQVLEIVESTHVQNRFACDPLIDADLARTLYRKLVDNCFDQSQFTTLVARGHGAVQGFIISKTNETFCQLVGKKTGSLDFIGVRPDNRNRGLGACLNRAALQRMAQQGVQYVGVRTLANNYPALRITFKTGFAVTSTSLHFHRWIKRPKIEGCYTRF